MEILKIIYSQNSVAEIDEDKLQTIEVEGYKIKKKLSYRASCLNMNLDEYSDYLGIRIKNSDNRKYTDEYIKELLESYKLNNGIVKIPVGCSDYIGILRVATKRGYNLEDFITSYGFEYERIRDTSYIDRQYKDFIEKRYVVEDKKIYINSLDPFYDRIYSYCYNQKIKLDDYVGKLGFERIDNVNELPNNYIQYDWKTKEFDRLKAVFSDENIILFLDEIANKNNEIYINTTSQTYLNLWKIANIRDMSINNLIDMLGYKRIYAWDDHKIQRPRIDDVEIEYDSNSIEEMLDELEKIQGSLEKIENGNEKITRNQTLIKK